MLPDFDLQVLKLTPDFYNAYPNPPYVEIETKTDRRYNCLLIQTSYDYFICIPFRSRVNHKYAYHFTSSIRSQRGKSALDYSKIVIANKTEYIDSQQGIVDADEYREMMQNINLIVKEATEYVNDYIAYKKQDSNCISSQEFNRRYRFSTLSYFDDILGV